MGYTCRRVVRFFSDVRNGSSVHGYARGRINRRTSNFNYNLNDAIDSLVTEVAQSLNPTLRRYPISGWRGERIMNLHRGRCIRARTIPSYQERVFFSRATHRSHQSAFNLRDFDSRFKRALTLKFIQSILEKYHS